MNPWDIIYALSQTPSRNEKIAILDKVPGDNDFWHGSKLAIDGLITFGVNKLPKPDKHGKGGKFHQFVEMTESLADRSLSGNRARDAIKAFAESCTENQWKYWYSRILEKKLDCGAEKIIIDRSPEEHKPRLFPFQGAISITNVRDSDVPTDAFVEAKYDGVRAFFFIKKKPVDQDSIFIDEDEPSFSHDVKVFSRSGKEYFNFGPIAAQLGLLTRDPNFPDEGIVIDGEVISSTFNELSKQARRKSDVQFDGMFLAFDIILMDDFMNMRKTAPLSARREILEDAITFITDELTIPPLVSLSRALKNVNARDDRDTVMEFYQEQVEAGFEGVIVKDATSSYNYTKDKTWLKIKPSDTWDLEVIGVYEGEGKYEGMLGGLICEGIDNNSRRQVSVRVGSGLTDVLRKELWETKDSVIGTIVEIEADSLSENQNGTYSLRFPRFVRFRDDK